MKNRLIVMFLVDFRKLTLCFLMTSIFATSFSYGGERIRLDRKHGVVNDALQEMLSASIATFPNGVGKIELGRSSGTKSNCFADLFVSPETVFVAVQSKKTKQKSEFYVDHPYDSFKDILFQALITQGNEKELSVDKKTGGYKFRVKDNDLDIEVKRKGTVTKCQFDMVKAVLIPGSSE